MVNNLKELIYQITKVLGDTNKQDVVMDNTGGNKWKTIVVECNTTDKIHTN